MWLVWSLIWGRIMGFFRIFCLKIHCTHRPLSGYSLREWMKTKMMEAWLAKFLKRRTLKSFSKTLLMKQVWSIWMQKLRKWTFCFTGRIKAVDLELKTPAFGNIPAWLRGSQQTIGSSCVIILVLGYLSVRSDRPTNFPANLISL